ncbi:MAG: metal-dependent transcriptional regulator [Planctomycetota bacterium]
MSPTSAAIEDYLKAVFHFQETHGGGPARTTDLARGLQVRKPSVTSMVRRLAALGLVTHSPRQGTSLTESGRRQALDVLRRHRLLKVFLVESLGLDSADVAVEAEILEHHLSARLVEAMDFALGHPPEDPHGHPIPDADGRLAGRNLAPLADLQAGTVATVRELHSSVPARLRRWEELGLLPGSEVRILGRIEEDATLEIRVAGRIVVVGWPGLNGILVERLLTPESTSR